MAIKITECNLPENEIKLVEEFFEGMLQRIEKGRVQYGNSYLNMSLEKYNKELNEEQLDVASWTLLFWIKTHLFKEVYKLDTNSPRL